MADDDLPSLWNTKIELWLFLFKQILLLGRNNARSTGFWEMVLVLRVGTNFNFTVEF